MSYSIKSYPQEQAVLTTMEEMLQGDALRNMDKALHDVLRTFDLSKKIYLMIDLSTVDMSFYDVMKTLAEAIQFNETWVDNSETLVIGKSDMSKLVADAFQQEQYGGHPASHYRSVEAALAHIHEEMEAA